MKILKLLFNTLLVILCLCSLTFLSVTSILKSSVSEETIKETIKNNDLTFIIEMLNDDDREIIDMVKEVLITVGVPEDTMDEVLNSEATKEFVGTYTSNIIHYLLTDEDKPITKDDIKKLISSNLDVIEEKIGNNEIYDILKGVILEYVNQNGDNLAKKFPSPKVFVKELNIENSSKELKEIVDIVGILTDSKTINFSIIVSIILIVLLIILNIKKRNWAKLLMIISTLYTFLILIIKLGLTGIKEMYREEIFSGFINYIVKILQTNLWIYIICAIGVFIVSLIIYLTRKKEIVE